MIPVGGVVRWGILGTARIARARAIPAIHALPEAKVFSVASREEATSRAFAEACDVTTYHGSYQALIDDDAVDAVYVPLPNALHAHWVRAALTAGKPVLCEKPLTTDPAATRELVEYAEANSVLLAEGFMYRHHPTSKRIAELITSGAVGTPLVGRGALSFVLDDPVDIRAQPALGGGALLDLGCYVVDALCRLYGGPAERAEGVRVLGETSVDEHVSAVLSFPGGLIGALDCSFRLPWVESVFEVRGDEGTIRAPHAFNPGRSATSLTLTRPGDGTTQFDSEPCDMFAEMFGSFSRAVLGTEPYPFLAKLSVAGADTLALLSALPAAGGPGT